MQQAVVVPRRLEMDGGLAAQIDLGGSLLRQSSISAKSTEERDTGTRESVRPKSNPIEQGKCSNNPQMRTQIYTN